MKRNSENWDYYLGKTFNYWTGPKPPASHVKYSSVITQLNKIFQSYNLIKEIINYYRDTLIGQQFNWYLSQNKEKATEATEAEEILNLWWKWQYQLNFISNLNRIDPLSDAIISMLVNNISDSGIGVGYLRLYQPKKLLNNPLEYKSYVLHSPPYDSIAVERDDDGFIEYATYNCVQGQETYKLLDSGLCEITDYEGNVSTVDLGGSIPIFELRGESLLTNSLKECQNSINKTLTLKGENLNYAGFLERVILNGQMPGEWIPDASSPSGERFVPTESLTYGANTVNFIQGLPLGDPRNPDGYTNPSISYREPIGSDAFKQSLDIDIQTMYMSAGLGHLLTVSDGSLSGVSRESIKTSFETRLKSYQLTTENCLESVFNTMIKLLNLGSYEATVQLNPALGKPLPEYSKLTIEKYNAGLISRNSAMVELGIKDPDSEIELIKREQEEEVDIPDSNDFATMFQNAQDNQDNPDIENQNS